jgi:hypothetical protein
LDIAQLYYRTASTYPEEQLIVEWQWSLDSFGEHTVGPKMDAMDFYAPHATLGCYYLDNFVYTRIGEETYASLDFDTDEIDVALEEDDADAVAINISNAQGSSIGRWTGWVDFGTSSVTTGSHQINWDAEINENSSLVGLNVDEPTLIEVGAMFPGSAYAGAAMGTKIVSAQYVFFTNSDGTLGVEPNTDVTFRIYGQGLFGQPGEVLAEKTVPYSSIVADDWTLATFDTPVDITGFNAWVTVEFTQAVEGYAMSFDGGAVAAHGDYYRTNGGGAFGKCSDVFSEVYGNFHIRMNTQGSPVSATWASLSKTENNGIPIGGSDVVTVNLNSIGLNQGDQMSAVIIFKTNDPENSVINIPLTLTVGSTAVSENGTNAVSVYPNPTSGEITVQGENLSSLAIYNVAGQLVRIVKLDNMINNIDMDVEAGVYFFSIYDNNGNSSVQRVVITK